MRGGQHLPLAVTGLRQPSFLIVLCPSLLPYLSSVIQVRSVPGCTTASYHVIKCTLSPFFCVSDFSLFFLTSSSGPLFASIASHSIPIAPVMDRDSVSTNPGGSSSRAAAVVTPAGRKKVVTGAQGTYELEAQPFSSGDHTQVFKAKETTTDVVSACKVIHLRRPSLTNEERDNIDREIAILSLMQHVTIPQCLHGVIS